LLIESPHPTDARYGSDESIVHIVCMYIRADQEASAIYMCVALLANMIADVTEILLSRKCVDHCFVPRKNRPLTSTTWVSGMAVQKPECAHRRQLSWDMQSRSAPQGGPC